MSTAKQGDGASGVALKVQVGGHKFVHGNDSEGKIPSVIDLGDGFILKARQKPPKGEREVKFYQQVAKESCEDPDIQMLLPFIPRFAGTLERNGVTYMKLSNLISGYHKPCVMDLKMGLVTYDKEASQEKIDKEMRKFPPLNKLGFQITGMMIYDPAKDVYESITNAYTRKLTEETIVTDGLSLFFRLHKESSKRNILPALISKLQSLENWFNQQRKFSFIASSLLITYEGSQQPKLSSNSLDNSDNAVGLHLIDFAHAFPSSEIDHNVLFGIQKLVCCLQTLIS